MTNKSGVCARETCSGRLHLGSLLRLPILSRNDEILLKLHLAQINHHNDLFYMIKMLEIFNSLNICIV